ncbi:toll/interleukin-1 receptor domain-containing protein [Fimbriimonas ginsengisoli]|uniref:TIR domain-containing protein n=1 Tax=Fimbriimonas ginsengisoli Gsoil 348 TaxID=661478 RepID=A0A068NQ77_FIMGI|nr:toll/interleukin-1 receptor domain-containing protein [Fimbriimonas ginsengisoli]AIE83769.1 hypothetical protein OP10G_0401 [Fimbriimonas ginsengisoli Gsoil 348]
MELPLFFLSHSGADADADLLEFRSELCKKVYSNLSMDRVPSADSLAYFDRDRGSDNWKREIGLALQRTRCFVCVLSGAYFAHERDCRKEFLTFKARLEFAKRADGSPPVIIPVLWADPEFYREELGAGGLLESVRGWDGGFDSQYTKSGLLFLKGEADKTSYRRVATAIASAVTRAVKSNPVLPAHPAASHWYDAFIDPADAAVIACTEKLDGDPEAVVDRDLTSSIADRESRERSIAEKIDRYVRDLHLADFQNLNEVVVRVIGEPGRKVRAALLMAERSVGRRADICFQRLEVEARGVFKRPDVVPEPQISLVGAPISRMTVLTKLAERYDVPNPGNDAAALQSQVIKAIATDVGEGIFHVVHIRWWTIASSGEVLHWFVETFWKDLLTSLGNQPSSAMRLVFLLTSVDSFAEPHRTSLTCSIEQSNCSRVATFAIKPFSEKDLVDWLTETCNFPSGDAERLGKSLHEASDDGRLDSLPEACRVVFSAHFSPMVAV